jgi:hypothetical protein
VIKINKAAGVEYYTGAGSASERMVPSYYTGASEKGEPAGQWSGRLAADLGLTGEVDAATMDRLYNHYQAPDGSIVGRPPMRFRTIEERIEQALAREPNALPERVDQIKAEVARSTRSSDPGKDLTYSIQKSVTVAHTAAWRAEVDATRSGDLDRAEHFRSIRKSIEGAILEANAAGLDQVSRVATSRIGSGSQGTVSWVAAPDIAVASFFQHTSRADDPQLHIHNVVLNKARNADGSIRAIDFQDLGRQRFIYSAVAHRVLAERLADMGLKMELRPDRVAREIVAVDEDVMGLFSQRRQAVTKAMAPVIERAQERLGRELSELEKSRIAQTSTLVTRQSKSGITDPDTLIDLWQDRMISELASGLGPIAQRMSIDLSTGPVERDGKFSPSAVAARALHAVSQNDASWTKAELMLEVERELPLIGMSNEDLVEFLDHMTNYALEQDGVRQVAGNVGIEPPEGLFQGSLIPASAVRYATPTTLVAERLIREAAIVRGREYLDAASMNAWLDEHYPTIGADQRVAVMGIASSDAALTQLVGPAGTGKSYAAGALTGAWRDPKGGRVHGLAVSQNAAEILREDGIVNSANVAAWLASQERLEAGRPVPVDYDRAVGPSDIVLVDEASMVTTADLDRVRDIVDSIGARMVLMGDPRQLGAIGAGGAMGLVDGRAETYTLSEVRRFSEDWESEASLRLREGDRDALAEYDRHGRLIESESLEAAIQHAARAAAADRLSGLSVVVSADSNDAAAQIANAVREHLVAAGVVEAEGVPLARTGGVAGTGDEIMTRQNDYDLAVINRQRFEVVGTGEGSLSVRGEDGVIRELPARYVEAHVQLAYGSTVHAVQGATVDRGYVVTDGRSDSSALYVGMTRGRDRNTAIVALASPDPDAAEMISDPYARQHP